MRAQMKVPFTLSALLVGGMAVQASLGLLYAEQYRDVAWIRAAWLGNDAVTLALGVPVLVTALLLVRWSDVRGQLLWLGMLGYGAYNYAFYALGAELNVFFPLYVVLFVLSAAALILALSRMDAEAVATRFRPKVPARMIGGYLVVVAIGLAAVWTALWAGYVFGDRPLPVEADAFRLVAALDLSLMVPALAFGGIMLWRRRPWGYVIASLAGVQGTLYLLVLSVNAVAAVLSGRVHTPGEILMWGPLALTTAAATATLLVNARWGRRADSPSTQTFHPPYAAQP